MILALTACTGPASSVPTPADLPTEGALSVLTYNVQGLPDPLTDSDRPNAERMPAIAPMLEAYDLVGLQEDFDPTHHATLTATSHPENRWFDAKVSEDRAYGPGLSVLSRAEVVDYAEHHYSTCHGLLDNASDCLASKGFQVVTLALGASRLVVVNTHHEAGGSAEDIASRETQVQEVLDSLANTDDAVLFMGDSNLRWSDPEDVPALEMYEQAGLRDACTELDCAEPDHIDRVMLRDGAGLSLVPTSWTNHEAEFVFPEGDPMSDHPPLSITLDWSTTP